MRKSVIFALALCTALAACAELPSVDAVAAPPSGTAPRLVPVAGILAQADALGTGAGIASPVAARADNLRNRANRLRDQ